MGGRGPPRGRPRSAEVGVWTFDLNTGRTETVGPYGRILLGRDTAPNFSFPNYEAFLEIVHPADRERIAGSVDRNRNSPRFEDEFRVVSPDGGTRWVLSRSRVVPDRAGGRGRVVGVVMDVTARREAARRREQLDALTEAGLSRLGLDDMLEELLQRVVALLASDSAVILLLERDGRLRVRASVGLEQDVATALTVPIGEGFAGRMAATGQGPGNRSRDDGRGDGGPPRYGVAIPPWRAPRRRRADDRRAPRRTSRRSNRRGRAAGAADGG